MGGEVALAIFWPVHFPGWFAGAVWMAAGLYPPIIASQTTQSSNAASLHKDLQEFKDEVNTSFESGFFHARFGLWIWCVFLSGIYASVF